MARAYSQDLRDRVIDAALKGLSAHQAAARFGVGDARPLSGCAAPVRPASAERVNKGNRGAVSSTRTAISCFR